MIEQYIPELEKVLIALERGDFEVNYPHEKIAVDGTPVIRVTMGEKPYLTFAGMHGSSLAAHIRERISIVRHLTFNLEAARKEVDLLKHLLHHENVAGMPGGRKPTHVDDRQQRGEPVAWRPIDTAPTDNKRPLYLARFHEGELVELDFNGGWEYWQESYEMPHINGYDWVSNNGIEEPTHWAYQDEPLPTTAAQPAEPVAVIRFERNKPGAENEMPKVISCNRLPDGDYQVFLAPQPAAPSQEPSVPECPYSCGRENLHKMAVNDGAYLAKSLEAGHPLTDRQRATVIVASIRLIEVCRAMLEASQVKLKKERK